jgi:hypothetical protein
MNPFSLGERVELISCPGLPGTVTGFVHGRVQVLFDDFKEQPPKTFRPDSLQRAERQVPCANVPKPVASGTRNLFSDRSEG